ncbi:hypothetical protein CKO31_09620 [Thiohalocapsa halophila]|uniref:Uncharacterized protein n=1 Tax=Thiohalocapsa halophila TaxID=69359 RepID=A0ABS1CGH1_9GAMM|nr:hypothetical protein [Thiohalocapsa halophila]MBK1630993.1 hypothetical protein [Thiohalocapsa halophila]
MVFYSAASQPISRSFLGMTGLDEEVAPIGERRMHVLLGELLSGFAVGSRAEHHRRELDAFL